MEVKSRALEVTFEKEGIIGIFEICTRKDVNSDDLVIYEFNDCYKIIQSAKDNLDLAMFVLKFISSKYFLEEKPFKLGENERIQFFSKSIIYGELVDKLAS